MAQPILRVSVASTRFNEVAVLFPVVDGALDFPHSSCGEAPRRSCVGEPFCFLPLVLRTIGEKYFAGRFVVYEWADLLQQFLGGVPRTITEHIGNCLGHSSFPLW